MVMPDNISYARAMGEPTGLQEGFFTSNGLNKWYDNDRHYEFMNYPVIIN
jgi:hypothetical protein